MCLLVSSSNPQGNQGVAESLILLRLKSVNYSDRARQRPSISYCFGRECSGNPYTLTVSRWDHNGRRQSYPRGFQIFLPFSKSNFNRKSNYSGLATNYKCDSMWSGSLPLDNQQIWTGLMGFRTLPEGFFDFCLWKGKFSHTSPEGLFRASPALFIN